MGATQTREITIRVDPAAADAYQAASETQRRKLDLLLSLRLMEAARAPESLEQVMDQISRNAQARGLTPEVLNDILKD
jgi:hypothetical protein